MNFEEYLEHALTKDKELHNEYESLESEYKLIAAMNTRDCGSCDFRHSYCRHNPPVGCCKHWKLGKCYTCKFVDDDDNAWFTRGCEAEYPSGCKKYKRNWKKTFEILKMKLKNF